jgi:dihydrofolate reductase
MSQIVAYLIVAVDGVVGEPAEWMATSEAVGATIAARAASTDTVLLGRATYEVFAAEWPDRSGPIADFLNTTPKLVVSTSLEDVSWQHTSLIDGNALITDELARLRGAPGKDVLVLGSATLVQSLLRRRMIDQLILLVRPVIEGRGRRLFDELNDHVAMEPVELVTFDDGMVSLSYAMNSRRTGGPNQQTPRSHQAAQENTMMPTSPGPEVRELDRRVTDGIDVRLLWNSRTNDVSIAVLDERTGEYFELDVDPEDAQVAFQHPYGYSQRGWIDALAA